MTVLGGSGSYDYAWSNGETTQDIDGLTTDNYIVTITDQADDCILIDSFQVDNIDATLSATGVVSDDICFLGQGEIDLTVLGGSGSYDYAWSNSEVTEDIVGLTSGNYIVTITDLADNCVLIDSFQVNDIDIILSTTSVVSNDTCSAEQGEIDLTVLGGSGSYDFSWSNSAITEDITGLNADNYIVTITDEVNNCVLVDSFQVNNI